MTSEAIKKAFKAHMYFCNGIIRNSWRLNKISQKFDRECADEEIQLRKDIYKLCRELRNKLREFYGPKIGTAIMREIDDL